MEIWKTIKAAFGRGTSTPPDARRLNAVDELALSASLGALADEETIKAALIGLVLSLGLLISANCCAACEIARRLQPPSVGVTLRGRCQSHSGAACGGLAAGLAGLAGGSTACDDGALRCCGAALGAGSTALVAEPLAMALRYAGRSSDFCALQSATSCGSIFGKGLLARGGCGVCCMIGAMQSTKRPSPVLAPPRTNPACSQSAAARCGGRGSRGRRTGP
jgi:hypothetical protein